jgi:hypothetical protein
MTWNEAQQTAAHERRRGNTTATPTRHSGRWAVQFRDEYGRLATVFMPHRPPKKGKK